MPNSYRNTQVHWGKSQAKILSLLSRHGVKDVRFTMLETQGIIVCEFNYPGKWDEKEVLFGVRLDVPLPKPGRNADQEKIKNQVHRALFYYLKVKFEALDFGIIEFVKEFFPHLVVFDKTGKSSTLYGLLEAQVKKGFLSGKQSVPLLEMK